MVTIGATARRNARALAERLGARVDRE